MTFDDWDHYWHHKPAGHCHEVSFSPLAEQEYSFGSGPRYQTVRESANHLVFSDTAASSGGNKNRRRAEAIRDASSILGTKRENSQLVKTNDDSATLYTKIRETEALATWMSLQNIRDMNFYYIRRFGQNVAVPSLYTNLSASEADRLPCVCSIQLGRDVEFLINPKLVLDPNDKKRKKKNKNKKKDEMTEEDSEEDQQEEEEEEDERKTTGGEKASTTTTAEQQQQMVDIIYESDFIRSDAKQRHRMTLPKQLTLHYQKLETITRVSGGTEGGELSLYERRFENEQVFDAIQCLQLLSRRFLAVYPSTTTTTTEK
jgi:hypothetical protein